MRKTIINLIGFVTAFLIYSDSVQAQNILVWKNVGKSVFLSPETGAEITSDHDIQIALAANFRSFALKDSLPEDLSPYKMIFITLGFAVDCG
mgnify:CR=1 FL=1